jgi:hypothetical protein
MGLFHVAGYSEIKGDTTCHHGRLVAGDPRLPEGQQNRQENLDRAPLEEREDFAADGINSVGTHL